MLNFSAAPGPSLPPAALPAYNVGDIYYYSNGSREQVIGISGETIHIERRNKRKISNFRDFTIPTPYLEGVLKEYYKVSNTSANALWPLTIGKTSKFSTQGRTVIKATGDEKTFNQRWDCAVNGTERVRVLAGEFDTYKIKCRRLSTSGRWWQNRSWNYSPTLGTYVMRQDFYKKSGSRFRELTAIRPSLRNEPANVRSGIVHAWQTALENTQAGGLVSWTDKKTGTSVQVSPLTTYRAANNQFCRTYKQYLTRKGVTRIYAGVACRFGKMKWRTPRRG
ncbi:MAG: hypothetical protein JKY92_02120 [Magnetovibrio sp.]|nr:hypothetical protein [Magnetovibrio sp.]